MVTCDQNSLIRKYASIAIKNTCSKQISILHSLSIKIQTIKLSSFKNIDERVNAINFQKSRLQSAKFLSHEVSPTNFLKYHFRFAQGICIETHLWFFNIYCQQNGVFAKQWPLLPKISIFSLLQSFELDLLEKMFLNTLHLFSGFSSVWSLNKRWREILMNCIVFFPYSSWESFSQFIHTYIPSPERAVSWCIIRQTNNPGCFATRQTIIPRRP